MGQPSLSHRKFNVRVLPPHFLSFGIFEHIVRAILDNVSKFVMRFRDLTRKNHIALTSTHLQLKT